MPVKVICVEGNPGVCRIWQLADKIRQLRDIGGLCGHRLFERLFEWRKQSVRAKKKVAKVSGERG